jgi:endogenous inhibitor of DNA gyrase (YacG/DUF329 family)
MPDLRRVPCESPGCGRTASDASARTRNPLCCWRCALISSGSKYDLGHVKQCDEHTKREAEGGV